VQDVAIGYSIPAFIRSSWLSVAGSLAITALIWVCALHGGAA
jgi:succinate dehydrogenase / fumarate reductase cytochrome b subunit